RAGAGAGVLRGARGVVPPDLRLPLLQDPAEAGPAFRRRRRQLPVPGREHPQASAAGTAEGDDGRGRAGPLQLREPQRRHRRRAYRLQDLSRWAAGAGRQRAAVPSGRPQDAGRRLHSAFSAPSSNMRFSALLLTLAMTAAASGCSGEQAGTADPSANAKASPASARRHDENSYSEPEKVRIADLALDLALDFDARRLSGTATYTLEWTDPKAAQLVLDTRDLEIRKVEGEADGAWSGLKYALAEADPVFGSKLTIEAPQRNAKIRVTYATSPQASGLQWLEPSMTEGGQLPFMFSQSQAIHARSWVPLQDTPGVRFTYSAHVTSRPDVMVLMSADNDPAAPRDGDYSFRMPQ